jgi:hypothetical protein
VPRGGGKLCPISIPPVFNRDICDFSVLFMTSMGFFKRYQDGKRNTIFICIMSSTAFTILLLVQIIKF